MPPSGRVVLAASRLCSAPVILTWDTAVTAKETARAVLDRLPDDCSLDDVLYHMYVVQTVQQGRADAATGTDDST